MGTKKNPLVMPVIKWVGGKRQLLSEIGGDIPKHFGTYFEPFFGGGAVLFFLQPSRAVINDINKDLITTYQTIKDRPDELIESLKKHNNNSEYFYLIRDMDRDSAKYRNESPIEISSRLIYLNKTCYNGLFRVNSLGQFNTPFGNYRNPNIVNEPVLRAVNLYLNNNDITILFGDFEKCVVCAQFGDFVYLDPPYDPVSDTSSFTGYNEGGFDQKEQIRLKKLCDSLENRKVKFLLSNSSTEFIKDLYSDYINKYGLHLVKAKRSINSKAEKRGEVEEILIRNYKDGN